MYYQAHPYGLVYGVVALIAASLTAVSWSHRQTTGVGWWLFHNLTLVILSIGSMLMWVSTTLFGQLMWMDIAEIGSLLIPIAFLIFCWQITSHGRQFKPWHWFWILPQPAVSIFLLLTNESHHLVFGPPQFWKVRGLAELQRQPGIWHTADSIFLILFFLSGLILLVRSYSEKSLLHRGQMTTILIGGSISLLVAAIQLLMGGNFNGLNLLPMGFTISSLLYSYAITRQGLLELIPIARGNLIESMPDAVIVLDVQERVVDINPAAVQLLNIETKRAIGKHAVNVLKSLDNSNHPFWRDLELRQEIVIEQDINCLFDLSISPLADALGNINGRLIVFRDVTLRRQNELALLNANQKLNEQLNENRILQGQLHELAMRDPLTNLFNRRYLEETLNQELARAGREKYPVSIIMMDLDRFKRINDTFGHKIGDEILQALANLLLAHIRRFDVACRYGGEEFVVFMPNSGIETAFERAELIRTKFSELKFPHLNQRAHLGISLGVATFPVHGSRAQHLLNSADQAMYTAKRGGRNRTVVKSVDS